MDVKNLLAKRLIIVAGKGGVGKTTTSSAIALEMAAKGRKTLLVTVDPAKRLEDALGMEIGFKERPIQPNLSAMMLDPEQVIRDHLTREVPEGKIQDHPMFRYVTNYMPGLNEMMAIGKLNDLRKEGKYDVIVVDTAPTGHALSFLSAPGAIKEMMSEKSLIKWAIRGYTVWQKLSGTFAKVGNFTKKKEDKKVAMPDIDFEKIFGDIEVEAHKIQEFLRDPEHSSFLVVTLPEKMPVEETIDLARAATDDLGMRVDTVVVNKVQPDPFGEDGERFHQLTNAPEARAAFIAHMATGAGMDEKLAEAMVDAAQFGQIRRAMNLGYIENLRGRLDVPLVMVPLFKLDVNGLEKLRTFQAALFAES
jgi:arsenite-transporting ATPase